ncbi:MAG: hypothetical protein IPG32_10275 [Saprospirales bacterium]|nr:hypothetical protein [Saprospirales bacterium]
MRKLHLLWLFAIMISSINAAYSITYTLNNGNWGNSNNWVGNTAPPNPLTAGNAIVIAGTATLNVNNYVVSNGATITINNGATSVRFRTPGFPLPITAFLPISAPSILPAHFWEAPRP